MSWLRGMLWKVPWRRKRVPVPPSALSSVWAFLNFETADGQATYQSPLATPAPGDALPFWTGSLMIVSDPVLAPGPLFGSTGFGGGFTAEVDGVSGPAPAGFRRSFISQMNNPFAVVSGERPDLGPTFQALVLLIQAEAISGTQFRVRTWVDNLLAGSVVLDLPYVAGGPLFQIAPGRLAINGVAAGPVAITDDEIHQWFADTKANNETAEIPGKVGPIDKTTDRWTATSVQPAVPNPLPNLLTGQDLDYVVGFGAPLPDNAQLPVAYGY